MSHRSDGGLCCDCHCAWPCPEELLVDLERVCKNAQIFVLEHKNGDLTVEAETTYAHQLMDVAQGILRHARNRQVGLDGPVEREPGRRTTRRRWKAKDVQKDLVPPATDRVALSDSDRPGG